jgi:hypothetical protein
VATQMDLGYIGQVALGDTLRLALQCRNPSDVPTSPTGSPSWAIYGTSDTSLLTGSLGGSDADSKTGLRTGDAEITQGNGFASGQRYIVRFAFVISGTTYAAVAYFVVV